jgi:magnesium transporter
MADELEPTTTAYDVQELVDKIEAGERGDEITELLNDLHPADVAEVMEELSPEEGAEMLLTLSLEDQAEVLEYIDDEETTAIAGQLSDTNLVAILDEMAADDAADLLGDLDPERAETLLAEMDEEDTVRPLLNYPEDTAGGLMVPIQFRLKETMTVQQALQVIRESQPDPELVFYLFVEDAHDRLVGVCSLRRLVINEPGTLIREIMDDDVISVNVRADQEECGRLLQKYDLLALPVVNEYQRMVGIITVDDLVDVVAEEAEEDAFLLGGMSGESYAFDSARESLKNRLPWLYVNMGTAFLAASVVNLFEATIAEVAVLAVFQGIVAGQGGNAGTQTLTLMVRGIATGDITFSDALDLLRREGLVGILQGSSVGLGVALVAFLWKGDIRISAVLLASMMINMTIATCAGVLVPMLLNRYKVDPAVASGVFVTALTDMCGFFIFLGLATWVLL